MVAIVVVTVIVTVFVTIFPYEATRVVVAPVSASTRGVISGFSYDVITFWSETTYDTQSQFTVGWRPSSAFCCCCCCACGVVTGIDVVYDELIVSEQRVLVDAELVVVVAGVAAGGGVALGVSGDTWFAQRAAVVALLVRRAVGGIPAFLGFATLRMRPPRVRLAPGITTGAISTSR